MTVQDMIDALSKLPSDATVSMAVDGCPQYYPTTTWAITTDHVCIGISKYATPLDEHSVRVAEYQSEEIVLNMTDVHHTFMNRRGDIVTLGRSMGDYYYELDGKTFCVKSNNGKNFFGKREYDLVSRVSEDDGSGSIR